MNYYRHIVIIINGIVQRFCLSLIFYFLLSVAERTFKQVSLPGKQIIIYNNIKES